MLIDNLSRTLSVCILSCSVVNLEISGNVSFQSPKTSEAWVQNLWPYSWQIKSGGVTNPSQSFFGVSTLNTRIQLYNLSQSFYNNSVLNLSQNYWKTNELLIRSASVVSLSMTTISSSISLINSSISFINKVNTTTGENASFVNECFMNVRIVNMYCNKTMIDPR